MSIDAEVKSKIVDIKSVRKSSACMGQSNAIAKRTRQIQKEKKECLTRALSEVSVEVSSQLTERARILALEEDTSKDANRVQTAETEISEYNLILGGLSEFVEILKPRKILDGKRPQSDLEYAFWKSVESRAGVKLDTNNSGKEQTNSQGMNCMQNFSEITDALLGMYPQEHEVDQWLLL